ncbi:MAG: glycosyltransferase [Verrucomicrobiota bacterium]|jgi:glycosyltransferase involved in cell wall biosynthesis
MSPSSLQKDPLISVLVPLYNHAAYVEECLNSIRDEDWPRLELLVLDDGSKDDSFTRLQAWVARHGARFENVWIASQPNQGICKTLNKLIAAAQGDFLVITDSDDTLVRGGIRSRFNHLQNHPEHLAVFGKTELIGDAGKAMSRIQKSHARGIRAWRHPHLLVRNLLLNWSLAGSILMCRRQTFDAKDGFGLYDGSLACDDFDMYLRFMSRQALGFVEQTVGCYRIHDKSFCRDKNHRPPKDESYRVLARHKDHFHGVSRWIVILQMWKSERVLYKRPHLRHIFARHAISVWRRLHYLYLFFRTLLSTPAKVH